ncbi:MAG: ketopantoate reductase family protein [Actinomycetota bacterium]
MDMKVAVIGAGAMGSLATHLLIRAGMEVVLYEVREDRLSYLRSKGLRLRGALEGESRPESRHPGEGGRPFDVLILAVKACATAEALRPLSPFVHRDTFYLSLQEGSAGEELAELVGIERAWAALAWASAAENGEGEVEVEECRSLVLGPVSPRGGVSEPPGLAFLAGAFEEVFSGEVVVKQDLREGLFARLQAVAPVSSLCALLGKVPRDLRDGEEMGAWIREAAGECARVAASRGLELPALLDPWWEAVWDRLPPPMLRDVMAGRPTERVHVTGFLLREAERGETRTPLLSALHSLLGEVERRERVPGEPLLRELRRRISEERGMSLM